MTTSHIDPAQKVASDFALGGSKSDALEGWSVWSLWSRSVDAFTIMATLALFAIGVVLAFAASPALAEDNKLDAFYYAWRHLQFGLPAFALMFVLSFFTARNVRRTGTLLALVGLIALILLPIYGVSHGKGAIRWFSLPGGISVQPTEFLKPGLVIVCAWMLSALAEKDRQIAWMGGLVSFFFVAVAVGLLVAQPDYGQAALIVAVWGAMFFVSGAAPWLLAGILLLAFGVGFIGYQVEPHLASRIETYLNPVGSVSHQIQMAERAVVEGGWFGRGLGEGIAKASLPDAHADFIFAVAAEEYGFVLAVAILGLFAYITLRALWRLSGSDDAFVRVAGIGLALLFGLQAFVNMAVTVQLLPAKGMTLPFVSYGGSSILASGIVMGMLLALTRRVPKNMGREI
ncbi:MAG: putative peptidoglycan glycosyltransferase FtsW [Pseudomonadota bacterium]